MKNKSSKKLKGAASADKAGEQNNSRRQTVIKNVRYEQFFMKDEEPTHEDCRRNANNVTSCVMQ
jgi:hypothetical protein